jgi:hypothetical protein
MGEIESLFLNKFFYNVFNKTIRLNDIDILFRRYFRIKLCELMVDIVIK